MAEVKTKIGLEIHVQLKTASKMFCRCDNDAFAQDENGKSKAIEPNSLVCPVCLGLPGVLPVANRQAIEWTYKTGLALNCQIAEIAKFDRKHYFYPDLPKGYQISQYDEPFCFGGDLEIAGKKIRLNRIHLEEDAGKLIHAGNKSLVDLNRAGTPLMEIVTEPNITSPQEAAEFLRQLQKIVRDVVEVSEASMEKGHMRCDANISVYEENTDKSSCIIEIKNLNSFRFVEKALGLVEQKLRDEFDVWSIKKAKETWGYNSAENKVYVQRRKEEAADYRYFPEPDLPPIKSSEFDLKKLQNEIKISESELVSELIKVGVIESDAKILARDTIKYRFFEKLNSRNEVAETAALIAKTIVQKYFPFLIAESDLELTDKYLEIVKMLSAGTINRAVFSELAAKIHSGQNLEELKNGLNQSIMTDEQLEETVKAIVEKFPTELSRYRAGDAKLFGFFMGQTMKELGNSGDPQVVSRKLKEIL